MANRVRLKFSDCKGCANQRSSICIQCTAGEFFEPKDEDVPTDDEFLASMRDDDE